MSEKRRDSKGRILRNGECQRKDGMYQYDYIDITGKTKCVYSWKLESTDPLPKGKRKCVSLRDKEREIQKELDARVMPFGGNLTVLELVKKYLLQKTGVRQSTKTGYKTVTNILEKEEFAYRRIDTVKLSDAKEWLIKLQQVDGRSYSSIHTIRGVVRPAFQLAVDDDLIRKNPFDFPTLKVLVNDSITRHAITHEQKRKFLEFIKNDKHFSRYYDGIYILFYTGLRISEFCGIVLSDIDLEKKTLKIERQLIKSERKYMIEETKTESGKRVLPLQDEVCECFKRIIANRKKLKTEPMVDGKVGFLFFDRFDNPTIALHWEKYFKHIVIKYNSIYRIQMPHITPHVCRHTYCTHCVSSGMNPKYVQYLMGHADIGITLNIYTTVDIDAVKKEVEKVQNIM